MESQDDVLTNLARVGDLRMISLTSINAVSRQTDNVWKSAGPWTSRPSRKEVRRDEDCLRVKVQLIDT